jgi:tetratricopeptide (TPR) repeat protein
MRTYGDRGRNDLALALANRMLEKDPANRALYLFFLFVDYSALNDPLDARQSFDEALPLAEAAGNLELMAQIHRHRGLLRAVAVCDRSAGSMREYDEALKYGRQAKAWRVVVQTLNNSGNPFRNKQVNKLPEALRRLRGRIVDRSPRTDRRPDSVPAEKHRRRLPATG